MHQPQRYLASCVLDAVERWATGCYMLRELELLVDSPDDRELPREEWRRQRIAKAAGRLDGVLLPFEPWEAPWARKIGGWKYNVARLVGVEVKVDRSDFNNGLKKGQFDRYNDGVAALYIATPHKLVKAAEVPEKYGHLVIYAGDTEYGEQERDRCVCKRHPVFSDTNPAPEMFWKLLSMVTRNHHQRERDLEARWASARKRIGERAAKMISAALAA